MPYLPKILLISEYPIRLGFFSTSYWYLSRDPLWSVSSTAISRANKLQVWPAALQSCCTGLKGPKRLSTGVFLLLQK